MLICSLNNGTDFLITELIDGHEWDDYNFTEQQLKDKLRQGIKIIGLKLLGNELAPDTDYAVKISPDNTMALDSYLVTYYSSNGKIVVHNTDEELALILDKDGNLLYKIPILEGEIRQVKIDENNMWIDYFEFKAKYILKDKGAYELPKTITFSNNTVTNIPVTKQYADELLHSLGIEAVGNLVALKCINNKCYRIYTNYNRQKFLVSKDEVLRYKDGINSYLKIIYKKKESV